jgi:hypothetical protein
MCNQQSCARQRAKKKGRSRGPKVLLSFLVDLTDAAHALPLSPSLQAGNYATLPQGWDKKIASFQCVQRSVASAR